MGIVTKPNSTIPVGFVTVGGVELPVRLNPEHDKFLERLLARAGGVSGVGSDELLLSQFEDAGIEETKADLFALRDELRQGESVASLRESLVAALRRIEALEQGMIL